MRLDLPLSLSLRPVRMLSVPLLMSFLALSMVSPAAAAGDASAGERAMVQARSALLAGDATQAVRTLRAVPARRFTAADAGERGCLLARFDRATPPDLAPPVHDAFTRAVILAYQHHWWHVLRAPSRRASLESDLLRRLKALLGPPADHAADFDAIAPLLQRRFEEAGYHAVPAGRTPPIQELLIWRQQVVTEERVVLPESTQVVQLHVLDDFASRGWSHYARCGHGSAAGWADERGVFAVRPAYDDLAGETFRVMLLGHEAQHFADYQRFPGLAPWMLEFRAKLAELALAQGIHAELLRRFERAQGDSPDVPHAYANRRVLEAVSAALPAGVKGKALSDVPPQELSAAARAALVEDSLQRAPAGARAAAR